MPGLCPGALPPVAIGDPRRIVVCPGPSHARMPGQMAMHAPVGGRVYRTVYRSAVTRVMCRMYTLRLPRRSCDSIIPNNTQVTFDFGGNGLLQCRTDPDEQAHEKSRTHTGHRRIDKGTRAAGNGSEGRDPDRWSQASSPGDDPTRWLRDGMHKDARKAGFSCKAGWQADRTTNMIAARLPQVLIVVTARPTLTKLVWRRILVYASLS